MVSISAAAVVAGMLLIGVLLWYFFGPKQGMAASSNSVVLNALRLRGLRPAGPAADGGSAG